jgi:hypothetical protein
VADLYFALLGIEFTIAVFLAGGLAAVAQVVASQVSQHATRLVWRSRSLLAGLFLLLLATIWSLAAAILLAGQVVDATSPIASPALGFISGACVGLSVVMLGLALVSAVRLLDPFHALARLIRPGDSETWAKFVAGSRSSPDLDTSDLSAAAAGLDLDPVVVFLGDRIQDATLAQTEEERVSEEVGPEAVDDPYHVFQQRLDARRRKRRPEIEKLNDQVGSGRTVDPLAVPFELAERMQPSASADRFERFFAAVMDRAVAMGSSSRLEVITTDELARLTSAVLFEDHVEPLMRSATDSSRYGHAARISRVVAARRRSAVSVEVHAASLIVVHRTARTLADLHLANPLCSTIEDLCELGLSAIALKEPLREQCFDEVCRALGELGQRIPRAFHSPNDPEVTIGPQAEILAPAVPLGTLLHSTWTIKERLFERPPGEFSPLIWCDAVKVTAREMSRYSRDVLRTDQLEGHLLNAIDQLYDIALLGAKEGDDRWTMFGGYALAELARDGESPFWREYHTHLGIRLVEIAVFAIDRKITSVGMGGELVGERLAHAVKDNLPSAVNYAAEAIRHGRFDAASHEANEATLRALGV